MGSRPKKDINNIKYLYGVYLLATLLSIWYILTSLNPITITPKDKMLRNKFKQGSERSIHWKLQDNDKRNWRHK